LKIQSTAPSTPGRSSSSTNVAPDVAHPELVEGRLELSMLGREHARARSRSDRVDHHRERLELGHACATAVQAA
jgi:hypothetical protein